MNWLAIFLLFTVIVSVLEMIVMFSASKKLNGWKSSAASIFGWLGTLSLFFTIIALVASIMTGGFP